MNTNLTNSLNEKRKEKTIAALKGALKALQSTGCDEWHNTILACQAMLEANNQVEQILKSYKTVRG